MKHVVLICVILLGSGVSSLRAGSIITATDGLEVNGKLTLTSSTVHVETSSSPTDINLSDILEADFTDTPFQLDCFFGSRNAGNQLPATWKALDIGAVSSPGSAVYADGTFTLTGSGASMEPKAERRGVLDKLFFVGLPWTGDCQWTARVSGLDHTNRTPEAAAGLMLRDTLDANSVMFCLGATTQGTGRVAFRADTGRAVGGEGWISMNLPIWLRMTRYGSSIFTTMSSDGKEWDVIGENNIKISASPWIGLYVDSHLDKESIKAVFDQVSLTPPPSSAQIFPPGVVLQSGSFLAGTFTSLIFDPANPGANGSFNRSGKPVAISRSKIAVVTMIPTSRKQIADMSSHVGLLMKNGDVMDGDPDAINATGVRMSSLLLGDTEYNRTEVRACFLHAVQAQPANYEIRLTDGSIVYASSMSVSKDEAAIEEVSGVAVNVSLSEIAQFRAGPSQVQPLAELNWKATPPPAAPPLPAAPAANAAPVANAVPEQLPPVQCWEGQNQQQIMETSTGTILEFPLTGKFHALGVRIALSPDSPPNAQVVIRVLADGREIARTPPFKAGDQPRFMEVTIQDPKTVALEAESLFTGAKVLFIDPVALRDK